MTPEQFWGVKPSAKSIPVGTRVRDAVTGEGPWYVLPLDVDAHGRIAVYKGVSHPTRPNAEPGQAHDRAWCAALKPEREPEPSPGPMFDSLDYLLAYLFGGAVSGLVVQGTWLLLS